MSSSPPLAADAPLSFVKVEGLGNDFLVLDARGHGEAALAQLLATLQQRAPALCDRRRGVGGDGVLVVARPESGAAHARMIVVNADGSRPQMCGNGLRCVALWLREAGAPEAFVVDTDAGPRACTVLGRGPRAAVVVDMGIARALGDVTPTRGDGRSFARVSMGNPHAVAFTDDPEAPEQLARALGPGLERDPAFPEGTNGEFAHVAADGRVRLGVWERGCGITDACGTGACATIAAAVDEGRLPVQTDIEVDLPGGTLIIRVGSDRRVWMTGPASLVFAGSI